LRANCLVLPPLTPEVENSSKIQIESTNSYYRPPYSRARPPKTANGTTSNSQGWEAFIAAAFLVGLGDAVEDEVEVGVAVAVTADAVEEVRASGRAMQIFTSKPEISCSPPSLVPTFWEQLLEQAGS